MCGLLYVPPVVITVSLPSPYTIGLASLNSPVTRALPPLLCAVLLCAVYHMCTVRRLLYAVLCTRCVPALLSEAHCAWAAMYCTLSHVPVCVYLCHCALY